MTIQEVIAVIDRSGSMKGKEKDTVGGINTVISELKNSKSQEDTINFSIKLFNNEQIMKLRSLEISEVGDFSVSDFIPSGSTALLDAIGDTLTFFIQKKVMNPQAYDSCVIYIASDGLENSSIKYNRKYIKEIISNAENIYNIKVFYLGANQDAILEAENLGIPMEQAINYLENELSTQAVYTSVARVVSESRNSFNSVSFTPAERQASIQPPLLTRSQPVQQTEYSTLY
uniref:VWFA domain-containing protein n=1 Tax=viral metagenome TaxID=1070528 RepID=A0A6C0AX60_9ZZZZ|tara:strand:+ start:49509 stop:50198 length:690 start_codon:yes stop_codon:yes gene_type:complete